MFPQADDDLTAQVWRVTQSHPLNDDAINIEGRELMAFAKALLESEKGASDEPI